MIVRNLSSNLTGGQIATILDSLLFDVLHVLHTQTNVLVPVIPSILINIIRDRRRKISALSHEVACDTITTYLCSNKNKQFKILRGLKVERNVWSKVINDFLAYKLVYQQLFDTPFSKTTTEKRIEIENKFECKDLWNTMCDVSYLYSRYTMFRGKIIEQYVQHCHKYAHEVGDDQVSHQDLHQLLVLAVSKGLDKYDSSSGALTSYLMFWLSNVRTSMYDLFTNNSVAFDVPNSFRQKIAEKEVGGNWSHTVVLEAGEDEPMTDESRQIEDFDRQRLLKLIKYGDVKGIYRLANNIEEIFV